MLAMPLVIGIGFPGIDAAMPELQSTAVEFDPNGGTGDFASFSAMYNTYMTEEDMGYWFGYMSVKTIPEDYVPEKAGSTFLGWCHESSGDYILYQPGNELTGTYYDKVDDGSGCWWAPDPFVPYAIWDGPDYPTLEFLSDSLTDGSVRYGDSAELTVYEQGNEMQEGTQ